MSRFVVFSDLHLHTWMYGSSLAKGINSRLLNQSDVVGQIRQYVVDNDIRTVIFLGDLFHTSTISAEVLEVAYNSFRLLAQDINLILLTGNHDQYSKNGEIHSLSFFKPFAHVVDQAESLGRLDQEHPMYAVPYTEDESNLVKLFNSVEKNSLVFLHQGVSGVPVNSKGFVLNETFKAGMITPQVKHVFAGHYHSHKKVNDTLTIPGSPLQLTWGDVGEKRGWLDVTIEEGQVNIKHIESKAPKFMVNPEEKDIEGNFIRTREDNKTELLLKGALSVEQVEIQKKFPHLSEYNLWTMDEVFEEYIEKKDLEPELEATGRDLWEGKDD